MTAEVADTISALRQRGDDVVEHLLRENESRWESLSTADRERLEGMAQAVASRLLYEPASRLETAEGHRSFHYVRTLQDLFALKPDEADGLRSG